MIVGTKILDASAKRLKDARIEGLAINVFFKDVKIEGRRVVLTYSQHVNYQPGIAELNVMGELVTEESEELRKKIEVEWKEKKTLPTEFVEDILVGINHEAGAAGTLVAYALGLPAPLNFPKARIKKDEKTAVVGG